MTTENKTVLERLLSVQHELKAPKGQRNNFGNYNYRSAEDILEAVKPLLTKYSLLQTITDEVVLIGDRYYIKATVTLYDAKIGVSQNVGMVSSNTVMVSAYAREADQKKGMDEAQVTGSASSYARKYALNGLYAIDDTKDADTDEYQSVQRQPKPTTATTPQAKKNAPPKKSGAQKTIETAFKLAIVKNNGDEKAAAVMMQTLMKEMFPGKTSRDLTEEEAKALFTAAKEN